MIWIVLILLGFFVAWNIGANDTANCVGVAVGGRMLSYRRAVIIVVFFVLLGAILEGWKNMKTVGEGIIIPGPSGNPLAIPELAPLVLGILAAAGIWVLLATVYGMPVSTSQSMVGAVIGAGLVLIFLRPEYGTSIQYGKLAAIGVSWVLNPVIAAIVAFILFKSINPLIRRVKNVILLNRIFISLVVVSAAYSAYALGANDVGTSMGALKAYFGSSPQLIALFGAVALGIGAITYGKKVMYTVGTKITTLDSVMAFSAQFGAALTVWSFVQFGMPVSTSQAIVGGVIGVGLVKGATTVSKRKIGQISLAWVLTPAITSVISFVVSWVLLGVL